MDDDEARPYIIVSEIGKGSFATVYKGYHEETHLQVAVKTVKRDKLSAKLLDNLQSEIQILKHLSHRHITKLIDIKRAQHNVYLIMEFCSGGDLTNYIKKRGRVETLEYVPSAGAAPQYYPHPRTGGLDEIVVRSFLRQLARALKFLRTRNLIHRDIKPQNLLLNPAPPEELQKGHPLGVPILKVADFGFARSLPNAMLAETLCGSPLYMAPEILRYEKYDAKADLWSVGAVLYEMAVGKPPFRAQNHIDLLKRIEQSRGVKFPDEETSSKHRKEDLVPVPDDIKTLIRALLKEKPIERATFEEFFASNALAKSKFQKPREPSPPPSDPTAPEPLVPEVIDPVAIPPSKFNFRRTPSLNPSDGPMKPISPPNTLPIKPPDASLPAKRSPRQVEGSVIPGETEEDGMLRREYVLVDDTQAVEFNRAVDELTTAPRRLVQDRRTSFPSQTTFPPPPHPNPPSLSSSPSSLASRAATNALNKAISLASKKLFGTGHRSSPPPRTSSSPRRQQLITVDGDNETNDPLEDDMLGALEDLAQKTDILTHWADEMYELVRAAPQKPLPDPKKFARRVGEAEKQAQKRKNTELDTEYNAVTCVAVYMLLMSFAQKGIDKLRRYQEHLKMRHPDGNFVVSEGFDDALSWFKERFLRCNERATLVKTWLPPQSQGQQGFFLDQLVYERALYLSRLAARKELLDQANSPDECEKLYEESLWCLYTLQDDLLPGNNVVDDDRKLVEDWLGRTKLRLVRARARMAMNDHDRLNDARADQNLVDVARIPAPWE